MSTDSERAREMLIAAYEAGATDTHNWWAAGNQEKEADFAEAARDYADSALKAQPASLWQAGYDLEAEARAAFEADCLYHEHVVNFGRSTADTPRGFKTEILNWLAVATAIRALTPPEMT